ncbi:DUF5685 family protein [Oceaniferula spumae]
MFGFLYAPAPSCGSSAKSLYQSIFCGLSCQLSADYSPAARFLVNRDSTFLALAGSALADIDTPMLERTCCNPLAKRKPVSCHAPSLSYAAAVTVSGLAAKLDDNTQDERGWRKQLPRLASSTLAPARDKAIGVLNSAQFPTMELIDHLGQQESIEQGKAGFMAASEPTAQAYGRIFSHLAEIHLRPLAKLPLFRLGSSLGRLIYWKDALDDWQDDQRRGRFNPLNHQSPDELPDLVRAEFDQLQTATAEIPWRRHSGLIGSVIGHTVHHHQEMLGGPGIGGGKKKKKDHSWLDCWGCDCCCCDCGSCSTGADASGGCCSGCDCCPCDCCSCS